MKTRIFSLRFCFGTPQSIKVIPLKQKDLDGFPHQACQHRFPM
jgi:hypothetical protein